MKGKDKVMIVLEILFCVFVVFGIFCAIMAIITEGWSMHLGLDICMLIVIIALNVVQVINFRLNLRGK